MLIESVGINPEASRLAGVRARSITWTVYIVCALFAGLAGLMITSNAMAADANSTGLFLELDAILAVVIGGTSLAGGRFSLAGTLVGAFITTMTTVIPSSASPRRSPRCSRPSSSPWLPAPVARGSRLARAVRGDQPQRPRRRRPATERRPRCRRADPAAGRRRARRPRHQRRPGGVMSAPALRCPLAPIARPLPAGDRDRRAAPRGDRRRRLRYDNFLSGAGPRQPPHHQLASSSSSRSA